MSCTRVALGDAARKISHDQNRLDAAQDILVQLADVPEKLVLLLKSIFLGLDHLLALQKRGGHVMKLLGQLADFVVPSDWDLRKKRFVFFLQPAPGDLARK